MPGGPYIIGVPKRDFGGRFNKPPPNAQIDWQHPLSQRLVGCFLFQHVSQSDLVNKNRVSYGGTSTVGFSLGHTALKCAGADNYATVSNPQGIYVHNSDFCITADIKDDYLTTNSGYIGLNNTAGSSFVILIDDAAASSGNVRFAINDGTKITLISTTSQPLNAGKNASFSFCRDSNILKLYVNRSLETSSSSFSWNTITTTNSYLFGKFPAQDRFLTGYVRYVYIHARALKASEVSQLHYSPYQFFWIPKKRVYFVPTAGGTPQECAATMAGAGTLATAVSTSHSLAATPSGAGTLSGAVRTSKSIAGSFSCAGTLAGAAYCEKRGAATLPGAGTMSASMGGGVDLAAELSGAGTMAGAVAIDKKIAAALVGEGTLAGAADVVRAISVSLSGQLAATCSVYVTHSLASAMVGVGSLSSTLHATDIEGPDALLISGPRSPTLSSINTANTQSSFTIT